MFKKHWLSILVAFAAPLVFVYWWWGGFHGVTISEAQRGPYRYAYLDHQGQLSRLPETQRKVRQLLEQHGVAQGASITVLLDDPRKTERTQLRAQTGYLIDSAVSVPEPLKTGVIPSRPVLAAEVEAAALLAPSKAYQALHEYLAARQSDIRMPTVEIYDSPGEVYQIGTLSVEMER